MTDAPTHPALRELQLEATMARVEADRLRGEAIRLQMETERKILASLAADRRAEELERRLIRMGARSFYCGSLERCRRGDKHYNPAWWVEP